MVEIVRHMVSSSKHKLKCPYTMKPTRLIVHNTSNDAAAINEVKYMCNNNYSTSFHYAVDDKQIVQGVEENRSTFNAGDGRNGIGNRQGISIEICYSKSGGDRFIKAEKNAAEFCAHLLKKYGWGIDKLTKHQDYSGKYCPHRTLDMGWDRFVKMVQSYMIKPQTFKDVPATHWAYSYIEGLHAKGIISGYGDGSFKPSNNVTRAEVATMICKECEAMTTIDYSKFASKTFSDVTPDHWAYKYVTAIYNMGIANGYSGGVFKPNNLITRAECAVMIRNSINVFSGFEGPRTKRFMDVEQNHWAYGHITDLYSMGIVNGKQDGIFAPNDLVTRAEIATMISNVFTYFGK